MAGRSLGVPEIDVSRVLDATDSRPEVAIVLGSGLSGLADLVLRQVSIPYAELSGVPDAHSVVGHEGRLVCGELGGVSVVLFSGRFHQYQGVGAWEAAWPARMTAELGCKTLLLTNAAGGINDDLRPGDIVMLSDHINLMGTNPLIGWPGPAGGNPFIPMRDAYDPELRAVALQVSAEQDVVLHDGVYAGLLGPSYETPAEVEYLRRTGADVVGMSTVPETIAARALELRVLAFSLVTNVAAGVGLSHQEVLDAGKQAAERLERLMIGILQRLQ